MALYDGFFDSVYDETTETYDREYASDAFTEYFGQTIGSGVCVHNNPDSFKVRMGDGAVLISPGYLFIQGYWLKNDSDHSLALPGAGTYAIAAHLNLGKRMIELEAVSVSTSYPDSLVLAIVNGAAAAAEDTRGNTDICGVIDSAGELSDKVEYAINYIDTQIEARLAGIDAEIDAQSEKLDAKIAEVQAIADRIVPPPVGTIKFTASQNVDENWLRCDGSFINEDDYPELVAALGKLTPGVESAVELLQASASEQMSNSCLVDGTVWVYLAGSKTLVGMKGEERREITVTGADALEVSPAIDIVLSVVDGAVYLTQNNAGANQFILLECAAFTGVENSIEMTALDADLANQKIAQQSGTKSYSQYCVPSVTKIGNYANVAFKLREMYYTSSSGDKDGVIFYISWVPGSFEATISVEPAIYRKYTSSGGAITDMALFPLYGFHAKNGNDMVLHAVSAAYISTGSTKASIQSFVYSVSQGVFGNYETDRFSSVSTSNSFNKKTLPVCANGECLINADIKSKHPVIYYANYNMGVGIQEKTIEAVSVPSRAKLFKESVVYAGAQGLWFVFVGTGLLFAENLAEASWGYLDTQSLIGYIGTYGCLNYDAAANSLYISGMQSDGTPKVVQLKLPDLYNYANDGAFLPNIASDGVPAYIKALESENENGDQDTLVITVLEPENDGSFIFSNYAQVLFNGVPIVPGVYRRSVSDLGQTFTVGVKSTNATDISGSSVSKKRAAVSVNGTNVTSVLVYGYGARIGVTSTETLAAVDYISTGLTLQGRIIPG